MRGSTAGADVAATARRWAPEILGGIAVGMVPWTVRLGRALPRTTEVSNWSAAWVGLDTLLGAGCGLTAVLQGRGDPRSRLTASATAAVALLDAWFDVTTSPAGPARRRALLFAVGELSLVGYCVTLASPRRAAWPARTPSLNGDRPGSWSPEPARSGPPGRDAAPAR
jgi:hypothetical protein